MRRFGRPFRQSEAERPFRRAKLLRLHRAKPRHEIRRAGGSAFE